MYTKKGFTLIELLVVIAILAVLAVAVVVILNPVELLKQGRDSTRLSDLAAIHSSLSIYLTDRGANADLDTTQTVCNTTAGGASLNVNCTTASTTSPMNATNNVCISVSSSTVDGTGWVPVNLASISSGSPLSRLPIDPINSSAHLYAYGCNNTDLTYEVNANMESKKYGDAASTDNVELNAKDGGNNASWYEIGNAPGLSL